MPSKERIKINKKTLKEKGHLYPHKIVLPRLKSPVTLHIRDGLGKGTNFLMVPLDDTVVWGFECDWDLRRFKKLMKQGKKIQGKKK